MSARQEANAALTQFKDFLRPYDPHLVGVGVIKYDGEWCILYSRAQTPSYADKIPSDIMGIRVITDFNRAPALDLGRRGNFSSGVDNKRKPLNIG